MGRGGGGKKNEKEGDQLMCLSLKTVDLLTVGSQRKAWASNS